MGRRQPREMHIYEHHPRQHQPQVNLHHVHIVEERPPYLLVNRDGDGRYAVVERRVGKFYNLHCGKREPEPMTDEGVEHAVGNDWCDEGHARLVFSEITERYRDLAEHIW